MEPAMMAFAFSRSEISRARSRVMRSSGLRPMKRSASWILDSGSRFRYGDSSSLTARACLRVPSKTGSPVVLTNSERTTVSLSVRARVWRGKAKIAAMATAASTAAPASQGIHFREDAAAEAGTAEEAPPACAGNEAVEEATGVEAEDGTAGTEPDDG